MLLQNGIFRASQAAAAGSAFAADIYADKPFQVSFDPAALIEM